MDNSLVPGLKHAIEAFTPGIEQFRRNLAIEREGDDLPAPYITEYLRGSLHAYALVVGGLKLDLAKAEGKDWAPLFVAHEEWKNAQAEEEAAHDKLPTATPATIRRLELDWERAKRRVDAAVIKYAEM
jgi:hypothetical protein